jgi:hypothetical protein
LPSAGGQPRPSLAGAAAAPPAHVRLVIGSLVVAAWAGSSRPAGARSAPDRWRAMTLTDRLPGTTDPDAVFDAFATWALDRGHRALPGADRGAHRGGQRQQRHPQHAPPAPARAWSPPAPTSPRWPPAGAASTPPPSRRW